MDILTTTNPARVDLEVVQLEYMPYPDSMRMEFPVTMMIYDEFAGAVLVIGYGEGEWEKAQEMLDHVNEDFLQSGVKKISINYNAL